MENETDRQRIEQLESQVQQLTGRFNTLARAVVELKETGMYQQTIIQNKLTRR